jgi:MinD superfamily P-loop ATPase
MQTSRQMDGHDIPYYALVLCTLCKECMKTCQFSCLVVLVYDIVLTVEWNMVE